MIYVAEKKAGLGAMHDESDVAVNANRPEVLVLRLVEAMEIHSRIGWIELKVKSSRLDDLLLVSRQPGEAIAESVSDEKGHDFVAFQGVSR